MNTNYLYELQFETLLENALSEIELNLIYNSYGINSKQIEFYSFLIH